MEVRKPGRPLSSCPHPSGSCSCENRVIGFTIPKISECGCPAGRSSGTGSSTSASPGSANRVQKNRHRKSVSSFTPATVERAIKADEDAQSRASSQVTKTPTTFSFPPSERTSSNGGSPASSTSSTPRINPALPRRQSCDSAVQSMEAKPPRNDVQEQMCTRVPSNGYRTVMAKPTKEAAVSDCCKPNPAKQEPEPLPRKRNGGCCGKKASEPPKQTPVKKSCCSGSMHDSQAEVLSQMDAQNPSAYELPLSNSQFSGSKSAETSIHGQMVFGNQPFVFNNHTDRDGINPMSHGYGFDAPLFHPTTVYQPHPASSVPAAHHPTNGTKGSNMEHNCHCGDDCNCFGCAAHPHNATMTQYLLEMDNYMRDGSTGVLSPSSCDVPAYPHQPSYVLQKYQVFHFDHNAQAHDFSRVPAPTLPYQNINALMGSSGNTNAFWPPNSLPMPVQATSTSEFDQFNLHDQSHNGPNLTYKQQDSESSPLFQDSPGDQDHDEMPTLSPSSFFWQTLILPSCNDATGSCLCGDGCECVGCLTHGGHNGVALETPTTLGANDFLENVSMPPVNGHQINLGQYVAHSYMDGPT
ncbi:hypothetical protein K432DRAFT_126926 [Lepidopterella palustris CBS 459.81]|uniref:Copper-fist domain-containing protein n=1 Tax=Lepidopterella palustris CBS 459.81 TaxID=1314670 RepID=A0A8E2JCC0_9PEZI|nr:hypothetical protein K432DRAFT_126926 [Lepidopterella palustris CBS 459.81]